MNHRHLFALLTIVIPLTIVDATAALQWEQLNLSTPRPGERRGSAGIYDAASDRLVFQGGETAAIEFLDEIWSLDPDTGLWTELGGSRPSSRCHNTFLVDAARGRGLLFGGFPRTNEIWEFDLAGDAWTDRTPPLGNPTPRCLHASVVVPDRDEMIVYGGLNGGFPPDLADTWSYSLSEGFWTQITADSAPGLRYGQAMALDSDRDRILSFGGYWSETVSSTAIDRDDLWAFDLEQRVWVELQPTTTAGPSARQFARAATLPDGSGMILFGGRSDGTTHYDDLWVLNFADLRWRALAVDGPGPAGRFRHTLVVDGQGERLWVAFGEGDDGRHFDDVWALDLTDLPVTDGRTRIGNIKLRFRQHP